MDAEMQAMMKAMPKVVIVMGDCIDAQRAFIQKCVPDYAALGAKPPAKGSCNDKFTTIHSDGQTIQLWEDKKGPNGSRSEELELAFQVADAGIIVLDGPSGVKQLACARGDFERGGRIRPSMILVTGGGAATQEEQQALMRAAQSFARDCRDDSLSLAPFPLAGRKQEACLNVVKNLIKEGGEMGECDDDLDEEEEWEDDDDDDDYDDVDDDDDDDDDVPRRRPKGLRLAELPEPTGTSQQRQASVVAALRGVVGLSGFMGLSRKEVGFAARRALREVEPKDARKGAAVGGGGLGSVGMPPDADVMQEMLLKQMMGGGGGGGPGGPGGADCKQQ